MEQIIRNSRIQSARQPHYSTTLSSICANLNHSLQLAVDLATTKGASSWLSALPLAEHGFVLHKSAFHDALALFYGWPLSRTPSHCACGTSFTVDHALSCPKGGLPTLRHNEIRDLTATLLTEVCHQVHVEPELQPVSSLKPFPCQPRIHRMVPGLILQ